MILGTGLSQCKRPVATPAPVAEETVETGFMPFEQLPADFQEFYRKFHSDSLYQMEHIVFPLQGLPDQADPEVLKDGGFFYTSDQWILHRPFDSEKNQLSYLLLGDLIVEERVREKQYNLLIIRRFARASGGWRLIYYAGINKYREGE